MSLNDKLKSGRLSPAAFRKDILKKSAPAAVHHEMKLTAARHRVVAVLCNDAVIDQRDVERSKPRDKHLCSANVLARRTSLTVRMVMREHNPGSVAHNGAARDGYRIEKHLGGAAAALIVAADQPAAAVDVGNAERFRMQRGKARNEERSDLIRVVQPDHAVPCPDAVGLIAAHARADERQIFGRARTDTLHLAQLIGRRLKDGMERAEMLHQSMGNRVGVPLPDGIIQQSFTDWLPGKVFMQRPLTEMLFQRKSRRRRLN